MKKLKMRGAEVVSICGIATRKAPCVFACITPYDSQVIAPYIG